MGANGGFWLNNEPEIETRPTIQGYAAALVCTKGHASRENLVEQPDFAGLGFCTASFRAKAGVMTCGARVIGCCLHCGARLRGSKLDGNLVVGASFHDRHGSYRLPFCERCGGPHPWATREQRLRQLENLVEAEQLGVDDTREAIKALRKLEKTSLSEKSELSLWTTVLKRAPALKEPVGRITEGLLTAYIKQQLGLP